MPSDLIKKRIFSDSSQPITVSMEEEPSVQIKDLPCLVGLKKCVTISWRMKDIELWGNKDCHFAVATPTFSSPFLKNKKFALRLDMSYVKRKPLELSLYLVEDYMNFPIVFEWSFLHFDESRLVEGRCNIPLMQPGQLFTVEECPTDEEVFVSKRSDFLTDGVLCIQCSLWRKDDSIPRNEIFTCNSYFEAMRHFEVWRIPNFSNVRSRLLVSTPFRISSEDEFLFKFFLQGASFSADYRNQTVTCAFQEYSKCYSFIASLGANFSAKYDETSAQINATCKFEAKVQQCMTDLLTTCNSGSTRSASLNVTSFIQRLCTEKSVEHLSFLDSSRCYNQFQDKRLNCVKEYSNGNITDAKSLCCSKLKTQECLRKDMSEVCLKNDSEFQNRLMERYMNPHTVLCQPYSKLCNSGDRLWGAFAVLLATSLSFVLQKL